MEPQDVRKGASQPRAPQVPHMQHQKHGGSVWHPRLPRRGPHLPPDTRSFQDGLISGRPSGEKEHSGRPGGAGSRRADTAGGKDNTRARAADQSGGKSPNAGTRPRNTGREGAKEEPENSTPPPVAEEQAKKEPTSKHGQVGGGEAHRRRRQGVQPRA